ncbi:hypothetical protein DICVIV_03887 [Dictyocaulus viviparus]|uniref:MMS19 nucleotide excision repair protein n=1 Tax=Dictyocaulus viviparus TaxID=29172 RepID=A0A0D8XZP2_DICVI|nr:hypothetical protein DICVIV_03887 [Dictyocaulus viviparus]
MTPFENQSDLFQQLVVERRLSLSEFFESRRPLFFSDSDIVKENAFSELGDLICSFPKDFLSEQQVELLLNFLLQQLDASIVAAPYCIRGINHLVLHSSNFPHGFEIPLFQIMFRDGNVQSWDPEKRLLQYIYEKFNKYSMLKFSSTILDVVPLGLDFVSAFIKTISGEQHPKCLPMVFRMFVIVAHSFSIGPLVEDMFEIMSWYFPIEFKQSSSGAPITQELLERGCIKCLTALPEFGPFCYLLIEEKMTDEECSIEQKHEACALLAEAVMVFRPDDIVNHLEPILGGLRAIGLNPKCL